MTTFVSVDVETSDTDPYKGQLLTVGAVAVIDGEVTTKAFYERVEFSYGSIDYNSDTMKWWKNIGGSAYDEAFYMENLRLPAFTVAKEFRAWVNDLPGEDKFFAANPATFDWAWIVKLFSETKIENPFHYRTLCMRSMHFAIGQEDWGQSRMDTTEPIEPHHALHDAIAQGHDLVNLLKAVGKK